MANKWFAAAGLLALAMLGAARIDEGPNMTQARHRVDQPMRYLFKQTETTLSTMNGFIDEANAAMEAGLKAKTLSVRGPAIFVYDGADGSPDKKFLLKVGWPVADDQKPADGFEVAELPRFESVSSVYYGPMSQIKDAYAKLIDELFGLGFEPTGVSRETYLHWEGMDSANNITLLSVGVKPNR